MQPMVSAVHNAGKSVPSEMDIAVGIFYYFILLLGGKKVGRLQPFVVQ